MDTPILMFHSVSDHGPGPVSLSVEAFDAQLAALADAGARGITVSEYVEARSQGRSLPPVTVVLTFDDGYVDFAEIVAPRLRSHGWAATVFVPTTILDRQQPWDCGDGCRRHLLAWESVRMLASQGFEFGAHSLTHPDLSALPAELMETEVVESGRVLSERAGLHVAGFAPPFGRMTPQVRDVVRHHYRWCVGTTLDVADDEDDVFDLPRVEMWYFRNPRRLRRLVTRGRSPYFEWRRALRAIKEGVSS